MKKIIILLFALISAINAKSQNYNKIDDGSAVFVYSYQFCEEQKNPESMVMQEMVLEVGKKYSKFYSATTQYADSLFAALANEASESAALKIFSTVRNLPNHTFTTFYVYKGYPDSQITTFAGRDMGASNYYTVTEALNFDWKIDNNSKKTILGLSCTKATCHFAGRDYEAWFSTVIPINDGPYKFNGLPGLIVRIADSDNEHIFELQEVKNIKEKPMYFVERNNVKTDAKGYARALEASKSSFINQLNQLTYSNDDMRMRGIAKVQRQNNFIEKY